MIFEDIANVMNARPVKEIMRKTGLTKNRVYSLRMGCTFHMDSELLFALQRMGYEVRVFAVGDPARRSRDGTAKERCGVAKPWPRSGQTAPGRFARRNAAPDFARQTQKVGPVTGQRGFAAGEMEAEADKCPQHAAGREDGGRGAAL